MVDEFLSIFQRAVFEFCSVQEMLKIRNGYVQVPSKPSDGDLICAGIMEKFINVENGGGKRWAVFCDKDVL